MYLQGNNGETDIGNRLMDMGRGEERVRCMARVTEPDITICKTDCQWEFDVYDSGSPTPVFCETWKDGGGREGGSAERGHMYACV